MKTLAHEKIFPKCSVIVHHGGIGTTTAGLRAGRPNIITPILYDQFDSAEQVRNLGQGIGLKHFSKLTAEDVAKAIKQCIDDKDMQMKAQDVSKKLRSRDGLQDAANLINKFMTEKVHSGQFWVSFDVLLQTKISNCNRTWQKW